MDFELWWLLPIPVLFFALGWIAARIDIKHLLRESRALPLSYFRGLNFLLNEQPDKAIESFIEVVKVDPQTIDLHFALGSLFRRQGEIDRAIRMHQNLLDRPDLPTDQRETATFELAQDFHRAGLLDRAEELFAKLDGTPYEHAALGLPALDLRDREGLAEGDRDHAAHGGGRQDSRTSRRSRTTTASSRRRRCVQVRLRRRARPRSTWRSPSTARARARRCSPATSRRSRAATRRPIDAWQRIESQNPAFLALVAERVAERVSQARQRRAGHPRARAAGRRNYPSLDLLNALFSLTLAHEGAAAGGRRSSRTSSRATRRCSGLDRLLEAQLLDAPPERRHDLELVKGLVEPAHQAARPVPLRAMRLSRPAVLLALPGLPEVGDLLAAADRDAGVCSESGVSRQSTRSARWTSQPTSAARHRRARLSPIRASALALVDRLDPARLRAQGRQGALRRRPGRTSCAHASSAAFACSSISSSTTSRTPWRRPAPRRRASASGC